MIFFGESVPADWVARATAEVAAADALLVIGSSLTVWSGYRFARQAAQAGKPLAILNIGPTRADPIATLKIEQRVGEFLPHLVDHVGSARAGAGRIRQAPPPAGRISRTSSTPSVFHQPHADVLRARRWHVLPT